LLGRSKADFWASWLAKKKAEGKPQFEGSEQTHEDGQGSAVGFLGLGYPLRP
jgi:hypothetical protein